MPTTTEHATIDRPHAEVFDYLADMSHLSEWDSTFRESERLDTGPIGVGSRFRAEIGVAGLTRELTLEIVEYDRPRRVVLDGVGEGFTTHEDIGVEQSGDGGSEVRYTSTFETDKPDLVDAAGGPVFALAGKAAMAGLERRLSS